MWTPIKRAIDAIKRMFARTSNIALWPLNILAKKVKRTNARVMRYAISARNKPLFLFAMLWFPTLMFGFLAWGLYSVPIKSDPAWGPIEASIVWFTKKVLTPILFVLREALPIRRALWMYRRLTRAKRA